MKDNPNLDFKHNSLLVSLLLSEAKEFYYSLQNSNFKDGIKELKELENRCLSIQKEMKSFFNEDDEQIAFYIFRYSSYLIKDIKEKFAIDELRADFLITYVMLTRCIIYQGKDIDDNCADTGFGLIRNASNERPYHRYKFKKNFDFFEKYPYDDAPDWISTKHFKCIKCGGQPIYFFDTKCPYPGCENDDDAIVSINVGIGVLDLLHNIDNRNIDSDDTYEKIYQRIDDCLPISFDSKNKKGFWFLKYNSNPYRDSEGFSKLNKEMYKDLAIHYIEEYKRETPHSYISKIMVRGLFGYHNYDIDLTNDVSVIFGSNALGKTTLFKLLNILLNNPIESEEIIANIMYLFKVPFRSIRILFTSGKYLYVDKNKEGKKIDIDYDCEGFDAVGPGITLYNSIDSFNLLKKHYENVNRKYPGLNSFNKFLFVKVNRMIDLEKLYRDIKGCTDYHLYEYFDEINNSRTIHTIDTLTEKQVYAVNDSLAIKIKQTFEKANTPLLVKEFNVAFGVLANTIRNITVHSVTTDFIVRAEDLYTMLEDLSIDDELSKNNFLKIQKTFEEEIPNNEYVPQLIDILKKFLLFKKCFESFYYEQDPSRKKVSFKNKTICLKAKESFDDNEFKRTIEFDDLSSGEKNIAIILFNLIFKTKDRAIVLIDEPEVSLHTAWQRQFTDVIKEIIEEKGKMQVIIASHSPFITSGDDDVIVIPKLLSEDECYE